MANILVVEDEPALVAALQQALTDELHVVEAVFDGEEGLWAARTGGHDLVLLDLMLPGIDGLEVCRRLRAAGNEVPILVLTARDTTRDVVTGLDAGANDFLTKPFALDELLARVRALLRTRSHLLSTVVRVDDLRVDVAAHRVWRGDRELALTARETQVLEYLSLNVGYLVSRSQLTDALWGPDESPDSNVLEVLVSSLRRKLRAAGPEDGPRLLHTVRGAGYVLREERS